jgi:hypothetical protein
MTRTAQRPVAEHYRHAWRVMWRFSGQAVVLALLGGVLPYAGIGALVGHWFGDAMAVNPEQPEHALPPLNALLTLYGLTMLVLCWQWPLFYRCLDDWFAGRACSIVQSMREAFGRFPAMLGLMVRMHGHVLAGLISVIPGVERFFAIRFAPISALLAEEAPAIDHATRLAEGRRGRIAGALGLYLLISFSILPVWRLLTAILDGQSSFLWWLATDVLFELVKLSLYAVYLGLWYEADAAEAQ